MASVELDEVAEHIMAIRLNRPERLNALDFHLVGEIHEVLDQLAARDDCKLAIGIRRRPLVGPGLWPADRGGLGGVLLDLHP